MDQSSTDGEGDFPDPNQLPPSYYEQMARVYEEYLKETRHLKGEHRDDALQEFVLKHLRKNQSLHNAGYVFIGVQRKNIDLIKKEYRRRNGKMMHLKSSL
jgi:hypothetical protein